MRTEIVRLDLQNRRRSTIGYAAGMALYMLVIVALYPAFKHSTGLDKLITENPTGGGDVRRHRLAQLTRRMGRRRNAYTNLLPLMMLLLTIGYGAAAIAGQDEEGTLGLLVMLPLPRREILVQKIWAMIAQALVLTITVIACVYVGRAFDVTLDAWSDSRPHHSRCSRSGHRPRTDRTRARCGDTQSRHRDRNRDRTGGAASYLLSSLAPVVHWLRPLRFISLFYWADGNHQLSQGANLASFAVLVGVGIVASLAAYERFRRFDVR